MDSAAQLYSTFTAFKPDIAYQELILWPEQRDLSLLGFATGLSYRSDKWHKDGEIINYIHGDTTPVFILVATTLLPGYPPSPIAPPAAPPGFRFSMLGRGASHCLDIHFINSMTGSSDTLDFALFPFYPWIAAHPNGNTLVVCYPGQIPLILTGPGLRVTERGIEG
jgi:hypothetical protein